MNDMSHNYYGELNFKGEACGYGIATTPELIIEGTWYNNIPNGISKLFIEPYISSCLALAVNKLPHNSGFKACIE